MKILFVGLCHLLGKGQLLTIKLLLSDILGMVWKRLLEVVENKILLLSVFFRFVTIRKIFLTSNGNCLSVKFTLKKSQMSCL